MKCADKAVKLLKEAKEEIGKAKKKTDGAIMYRYWAVEYDIGQMIEYLSTLNEEAERGL